MKDGPISQQKPGHKAADFVVLDFLLKGCCPIFSSCSLAADTSHFFYISSHLSRLLAIHAVFCELLPYLSCLQHPDLDSVLKFEHIAIISKMEGLIFLHMVFLFVIAGMTSTFYISAWVAC